MKTYLTVVAWCVILVLAFGLACQPEAQIETKTVMPETAVTAGTKAVEPNTPAETETVKPVDTVAVEPEKVEPNTPAEKTADSVVVTVNGTDFTAGQLEAEVKPQLDRMAAQGSKIPPQFVEQYKAQIRKQILDRMIVEQLLDEQVKKANIVVTEQDVNDQLQKMATQQGLSMDDFKALAEAHGQSFDDVKQRFRKGLPYQRLIEAQFAGKLNITDNDANAYYLENKNQFEIPEQVGASHILIMPDPNIDPNEAKAAAKIKAENLLKQIKEGGADFAALAKANSADPGSAAQGGVLGLFGKGQMVPPFEQAAFALKPGEISDVVETQYGYHIIKVTDHKDPNTLTFEQVKDNIIKMLTQKKQGEIAREYIESLKANAKIVYPPGMEPSAGQPPVEKPAQQGTE